MIETTQKKVVTYELTEEANGIVKNGSHEYNVFKAIGVEGLAQSEVMVCIQL